MSDIITNYKITDRPPSPDDYYINPNIYFDFYYSYIDSTVKPSNYNTLITKKYHALNFQRKLQEYLNKHYRLQHIGKDGKKRYAMLNNMFMDNDCFTINRNDSLSISTFMTFGKKIFRGFVLP